jgi:multiple sugar transport system permease protein
VSAPPGATATPAPPARPLRPRRRVSRRRVGGLVRGAIVTLYALVAAFPFYWMALTAFKENRDLYDLQHNPLWFNLAPTLAHVEYLFTRTRFARWLLNSLVIAVCVVGLTLATATPAGYALARLRLPGARPLAVALFATYLVPPSLLFLPLTRVVHALHIQNTIWALVVVLPTISIPFATWLLLGFFRSVPRELEEAALIDGCTRPQAVWRVVLPVSRAGLGAAGMFAAVITLQAFLYPLVLTSSSAAKPVTLGVVTDLVRGDVFFWGELMAAALIAGLPVALLFNVVLDDFVAGITSGAGK